jgi:hypothetical protein
MKLTEAQKQIASDTHRFRVCIAGRRFGKTFLSIRELAYHARLPDQEIWYVAPTYRMARQIVWRKLKHRLMDLKWIRKTNESELTISLKNGSTIYLKGADNPDSLRGNSIHFLVCDEFADIEPTAFMEVLRPSLADTQGKALFIGTPKGVGNWAHELYQMEVEQPSVWKSWQFTTLQGGNVPPGEIEQARKDLGEREFKQEFEASFVTYAGRIYYAFDRKQNVKPWEGDYPDIVHIGMDQNVNPMSAVVFAHAGDTLHVIEEIRIFGSNTDEMVDEIKTRYGVRKIFVYPDPAGSQRRSSAGGRTDITILQNAGFVVKAPHNHTPVRDRFNAVNSKLCNSKGERKLYVDPKCKNLIDTLERHSFKEGTNQPDKDNGLDHLGDALGYCVDWLYPIKKNTEHIQQPLRWDHKTGVRK